MDKKTYQTSLIFICIIIVIFLLYCYATSKKSQKTNNNFPDVELEFLNSPDSLDSMNTIQHYRSNVPVPSQVMRDTNEEFNHFSVKDQQQRLQYIQLSDSQANKLAENYIKSSGFIRNKTKRQFSPYDELPGALKSEEYFIPYKN